MSAGNEISNWAVVDLGATDHIFYNEHEKNGEEKVHVADGSHFCARRVEKVSISLPTASNKVIKVIFDSILATSYTQHNLISLPQLAAAGWDISLTACTLIAPTGTRVQMTKRNGLYYVQIFRGHSTSLSITIPHSPHDNQAFVSTTTNTTPLQLLHHRIFGGGRIFR